VSSDKLVRLHFVSESSKVHRTFFTSLKGLCKRWFSFNKMEMTAKGLLENINKTDITSQ